MTEQSGRDAPQNEQSRPEWVEEAEDALERAAESLRTAWDETRDSRVKALESAKQAARQLGEAIDRGVDAARSRWQAAETGVPSTEAEAAPDHQSGAGEEE